MFKELTNAKFVFVFKAATMNVKPTPRSESAKILF